MLASPSKKTNWETLQSEFQKTHRKSRRFVGNCYHVCKTCQHAGQHLCIFWTTFCKTPTLKRPPTTQWSRKFTFNQNGTTYSLSTFAWKFQIWLLLQLRGQSYPAPRCRRQGDVQVMTSLSLGRLPQILSLKIYLNLPSQTNCESEVFFPKWGIGTSMLMTGRKGQLNASFPRPGTDSRVRCIIWGTNSHTCRRINLRSHLCVTLQGRDLLLFKKRNY